MNGGGGAFGASLLEAGDMIAVMPQMRLLVAVEPAPDPSVGELRGYRADRRHLPAAGGAPEPAGPQEPLDRAVAPDLVGATTERARKVCGTKPACAPKKPKIGSQPSPAELAKDLAQFLARSLGLGLRGLKYILIQSHGGSQTLIP
jgi:hypothetical protein